MSEEEIGFGNQSEGRAELKTGLCNVFRVNIVYRPTVSFECLQ